MTVFVYSRIAAVVVVASTMLVATRSVSSFSSSSSSVPTSLFAFPSSRSHHGRRLDSALRVSHFIASAGLNGDDSENDDDDDGPSTSSASATHVVVTSTSASTASSVDRVTLGHPNGDAVDARPRTTKTVWLLSDSTGVTVKTALSKCLSQFDWEDDECFLTENGAGVCEIERRTFTFVRSEETVLAILEQAARVEAMVAFTFAMPNLRVYAATVCGDLRLPHVDLMGPMIDTLSGFLGMRPVGNPGKQALNDGYYGRIAAMEFTLKADDGKAPSLLKEAEVVLVGVSRTGKTPLSVVLSQTTGWKVCNIPLVYEVPPPKELLADDVDPRRVFCLMLHPRDLGRIRKTRLEQQGLSANGKTAAAASTYADRDYLMKDLIKARSLAKEKGWTEIDVTGRSVEETSSIICDVMSERFGYLQKMVI